MEGLKAADIDLDRKVLADLAVSDEKAFDAIFAQAKKAIEAMSFTGTYLALFAENGDARFKNFSIKYKK